VKAYLQSWLQCLENDQQFIFKASAAAAKAADYVLSFSRETETASA
jgi:antirestriction protein ArdC